MGQSAHIGKLRADFSHGKNVHAYLFAGPRGTGKKSVALLCAMASVCRAEEGKRPCGVCGPCRRMLSGTHPDVHRVVPEKGKQLIGVDVMRAALDEVSVKSFEGGAKALVFPEAERMTPQAQNCLLKTLEEPPEATAFFLITDQPGALLPTIVSRCRVVRFHPLSEQACAKRLMQLGMSEADAKRGAHMAEGCVGQALEIDAARLELLQRVTRDAFSVHAPGDALAVINGYKEDKDGQRQILDVLEAALRDILLCQAGRAPLAPRLYAQEAERYAQAVPLSGGLALQACITQARMMLGSNVSFASAMEHILLKISEEYRTWPW